MSHEATQLRHAEGMTNRNFQSSALPDYHAAASVFDLSRDKTPQTSRAKMNPLKLSGVAGVLWFPGQSEFYSCFRRT